MPSARINRDAYEAIRAQLLDHHERGEDGATIITGNHEDEDRVTLRREANVFTITADSLEFVRP